jgi:hypothetical protein
VADKESNKNLVSTGYFLDLARMSTGLLVGVLALMTFLLTVGLQKPVKPFEPVFYATVTLLGLNLVLYAVSNGLQTKVPAKTLRVIRLLQQLVFVLGVIAVVTLMIVSSRIFFNVPTQPGQGM